MSRCRLLLLLLLCLSQCALPRSAPAGPPAAGIESQFAIVNGFGGHMIRYNRQMTPEAIDGQVEHQDYETSEFKEVFIGSIGMQKYYQNDSKYMPCENGLHAGLFFMDMERLLTRMRTAQYARSDVQPRKVTLVGSAWHHSLPSSNDFFGADLYALGMRNNAGKGRFYYAVKRGADFLATTPEDGATLLKNDFFTPSLASGVFSIDVPELVPYLQGVLSTETQADQRGQYLMLKLQPRISSEAAQCSQKCYDSINRLQRAEPAFADQLCVSNYLVIHTKLYMYVESAQPVQPWVQAAASGGDGEDAVVYREDTLGNRVPRFDRVGYRAGQEAPPYFDVPVVRTLTPQQPNDLQNIRAALEEIAALPVDEATGFRGALLLANGTFFVNETIDISVPGVVVRGVGEGRSDSEESALGVGGALPLTLIQTTLPSLASIFRFVPATGGGGKGWQTIESIGLLSGSVPIGGHFVNVSGGSALQPGERVVVRRAKTSAWIDELVDDRVWPTKSEYPRQFIGNEEWSKQWRGDGMPELSFEFERTVVGVSGNTIELDAPITVRIEADGRDRSSTISRVRSERLSRVGVELVRFQGGARAVVFDAVEDGWAARISCTAFSDTCVTVERNSRQVSVARCHTSHADQNADLTSPTRGVLVRGQQNLVSDFTAHGSVTHALLAGASSVGPNAFLNSRAEQQLEWSGAEANWANGALFENVAVNSKLAAFRYSDQQDYGRQRRTQPPSGWMGAALVFFRCFAQQYIDVDNPPGSYNWVIRSNSNNWTYGSAEYERLSYREPHFFRAEDDLPSLFAAQGGRQWPVCFKPGRPCAYDDECCTRHCKQAEQAATLSAATPSAGDAGAPPPAYLCHDKPRPVRALPGVGTVDESSVDAVLAVLIACSVLGGVLAVLGVWCACRCFRLAKRRERPRSDTAMRVGASSDRKVARKQSSRRGSEPHRSRSSTSRAVERRASEHKIRQRSSSSRVDRVSTSVAAVPRSVVPAGGAGHYHQFRSTPVQYSNVAHAPQHQSSHYASIASVQRRSVGGGHYQSLAGTNVQVPQAPSPYRTLPSPSPYQRRPGAL